MTEKQTSLPKPTVPQMVEILNRELKKYGYGEIANIKFAWERSCNFPSITYSPRP